MTNASIARLFEMTSQGIGKWKKEKRPIIAFIEKYLNDENIQEFLETGKIQKFENITFVMDKYLLQLRTVYINSFIESQSLLHQPSMHNEFRDFYFSFLANYEKINFPFNINIVGIQSLLTNFLYQYQIREIEKFAEKKEGFEDKSQDIFDDFDIFHENKQKFNQIMLHFFIFNTWTNDMYYFLELVKKDEFEYFINSKNDELLYQGIGYLVYSYYPELNTKLDLVFLTYLYFLNERNLISKDNIKNHIAERVKNPKYFKEIDEKIEEKHLNRPYPVDNNDFDFTTIDEKEIEELNIEELLGKNKL
jgi:hypothetical protein